MREIAQESSGGKKQPSGGKEQRQGVEDEAELSRGYQDNGIELLGLLGPVLLHEANRVGNGALVDVMREGDRETTTGKVQYGGKERTERKKDVSLCIR